ncbi:competence protein ComFA [Alkalibacillus flavidus]|uniref:Competence protein ComFA n=1 Tax=Alkalibacillus flavidus TaxID=546021 RepID=A0ABV2KTT9_9BACI
MNVSPLIEDMARKFATKRLLKSELNISDLRLKYLLKHNYLTEIPSIKTTFGFTTCERCFNRKPSQFGKIPRANHTPIIYCKHCIQMGRTSTFEPLYEWTGPPPSRHRAKNPLKWRGTLTPLQQRASDRLIKSIKQNQNLLIDAVCGAGKTEMLYHGIAHALESDKRICIATPRADVVKELAPRLRRDFPTIHQAALYGGTTEQDINSHLVIATTHQLLRYINSFDVVIIDEVDAFPYHHDNMLPKAVNRATKPTSSTIYLTATPRLKQKWLINTHQLPSVSIPARFHGHPLPVPTKQPIFRLTKQLEDDQLPPAITDWIHQKQTDNRRFLLFAPTIDLAEKLSTHLDIPYVHAASPDRLHLIHQFRARNLPSLITTTILERGVTFPSIDVAVIQADHHVFDEAALIQIAGRAGRSAQDPTGDVTFFYDETTLAINRATNYTIRKNLEAKGSHS